LFSESTCDFYASIEKWHDLIEIEKLRTFGFNFEVKALIMIREKKKAAIPMVEVNCRLQHAD
jgi:hypothetical protein